MQNIFLPRIFTFFVVLLCFDILEIEKVPTKNYSFVVLGLEFMLSASDLCFQLIIYAVFLVSMLFTLAANNKFY